MSQESRVSGETLRQKLARWREFFFAQKYRFDLGQSFLVVINFTLLIITASDKLQIILGIPRLRSILILIVPLGFMGVWGCSGISWIRSYARPKWPNASP